MKCNYPDCDGGPATGYCHKECRQMNERITIHTRIIKVERKRVAVKTFMGADGEPEVVYEDLGWFIQLAGTTESIAVGKEKPEFEVGQPAKVTIEILQSQGSGENTSPEVAASTSRSKED